MNIYCPRDSILFWFQLFSVYVSIIDVLVFFQMMKRLNHAALFQLELLLLCNSILSTLHIEMAEYRIYSKYASFSSHVYYYPKTISFGFISL